MFNIITLGSISLLIFVIIIYFVIMAYIIYKRCKSKIKINPMDNTVV